MMTIADRIQSLRRAKGISQEELADRVGVSRQAVSKWESEQSVPDLDRVILLSEYFDVTTDYLLRGVESPGQMEAKNKNNASGQILYIGSTAFLAIGLLLACGGWYAEQTAVSVWGGMIVQALGIAGYFIGRLLTRAGAPLLIKWLNIALALFMPVSLAVGAVFRGMAAPYPGDLRHGIIFAIAYLASVGVAYILLSRKKK